MGCLALIQEYAGGEVVKGYWMFIPNHISRQDQVGDQAG